MVNRKDKKNDEICPLIILIISGIVSLNFEMWSLLFYLGLGGPKEIVLFCFPDVLSTFQTTIVDPFS